MNALETLPLVLFVVLLELAIGGVILMMLMERVPDTPVGFLRVTSVVNGCAAAFAALIVPSLPRLDATDVVGKAAYVLAALMAVSIVTSFAPWPAPRRAVELLASALGVVLLVGASTMREGNAYDVLAIVALPLGALALGGVDAAMILGHWYLTAPKLSPRPLQTAALIFFMAVALQAVALGLSASRGFVSTALDANAAATLLRIVVGIGAPLPIALAAWWTARMNTQSSTGLLYIALAMVMAGEIMARMLFYVAGVPV